MINRREFIKKTVAFGIYSALHPLSKAIGAVSNKKVKMLVLGIDGMDISLTRTYMQKGLLPNFSKLAKTGSLQAVSSSFPPQSPVAWSNFSIGASSHVHGIYDFIHRDPATMTPHLSTSTVKGSSKSIQLGHWNIPLSSGQVDLLRKGRPFWEYLADYDIPTTVFKMPGNFPCKSKNVRMVSGMGTPDLRGGYGNFTLFSTSSKHATKKISGGVFVPIKFEGQMATSRLAGPKNTLHIDKPETYIPINIWRDQSNEVVRILIQDREFLLKKGEWTNWVPLSFPMVSYFAEVKGICKIYIKSIHPDFSMYVSPINIDPSDPSLPVVSSKDYGDELKKHVGYFYTQGLPADTKALSSNVLNDQEYLDLEYQILDERRRILEYELNRFEKQSKAFLFYYISNLDQATHMFWRINDPSHPCYDKQLKRIFGNVLMHMYMEMDHMLGDVMDRFDINNPDFRLIVMSDHGFAPFRRQVNVNTWLYENGYINLLNNNQLKSDDFFGNVNWSRTVAYNIGINALYLNLIGREKFGIVSQSQGDRLLFQIRQELLNLQDPDTGQKAVSNVQIVPSQVRRKNKFAPDIIIGWNRGYRTSWDSILGGFSAQVIRDNNDKWSGDHCIDPDLVPAILFCNKPLQKKKPALFDITATILAEYGIPIPPQMEGKPLYMI